MQKKLSHERMYAYRQQHLRHMLYIQVLARNLVYVATPRVTCTDAVQGGERTRAGRKLAAEAAAAAARSADAPIPPRDPSPQPPDPTDKADVAAVEAEEAERQERAAAAEPATVSRSVSAVVTEATEQRLRRWKRTGVVDLHGGSWSGRGGSRESSGGGGGGGEVREGLGGLEARLSLSDVKLLTGTIRCGVATVRTFVPTVLLRL